jgi:hypothetical protein
LDRFPPVVSMNAWGEKKVCCSESLEVGLE